MSNHSTATPPEPSVLGTVHTLYENLTRPHPSAKPRPPWAIVDAEGREIRYRVYEERHYDSLVAMYDAFGLGDRAQGVPPVGEDRIRSWLDAVLDGESVVAHHGDQVVGHVLFVPDNGGDHELAIYVHPDYQRAGIGRALLRTGLGHASTRGVDRVWLCVEAHRRGVEQLYRDVGFTLDDPIGTTFHDAPGSTHELSQTL